MIDAMNADDTPRCRRTWPLNNPPFGRAPLQVGSLGTVAQSLRNPATTLPENPIRNNRIPAECQRAASLAFKPLPHQAADRPLPLPCAPISPCGAGFLLLSGFGCFVANHPVSQPSNSGHQPLAMAFSCFTPHEPPVPFHASRALYFSPKNRKSG